MSHAKFVPQGIIPAVLLPFADDFSIDEKSFRKHLSDVAATGEISGLTVNAHSTEVASCPFEEQRRVLDIARDEIGGRLPIVNGIWLTAASKPRASPAWRRRARCRAVGVPAGAVHARPIAGDGGRAFQAPR